LTESLTWRGSPCPPPSISQFGNYSLHAKIFVLDRERLFVGSMNFDQRSMHLNTEIGLIIDSPALAQQAAAGFEAMASLPYSYQVMFESPAAARSSSGARRKTANWSSTIESRHAATDSGCR
jgi:putative cardiolipin synthase